MYATTSFRCRKQDIEMEQKVILQSRAQVLIKLTQVFLSATTRHGMCWGARSYTRSARDWCE